MIRDMIAAWRNVRRHNAALCAMTANAGCGKLFSARLGYTFEQGDVALEHHRIGRQHRVCHRHIGKRHIAGIGHRQRVVHNVASLGWGAGAGQHA